MPTALKEMSPDELREHAKNLRAEFAELSEGTRSDEQNARVRAISAEAEQLDTNLTLALVEEMRQIERHGGNTAAAFANAGGNGFRSGAEQLIESAEYKTWVDHGMAGDGFRTVLNAGIRSFEAGQRDPSFIGTDFGSGGPPNASTGNLNSLLPVGQPIPPTPRQAKLYLRDLIPVMNTTLSQIPYVRELAPTTTELGASAVLEGSAKPDASLNFQGASAAPTVIAADLTLSKQLFEDASFVVQYINGRLPYLVKFSEDNEFLNGNGGWPNITGLLQTTGVQLQDATAGDQALTIGNSLAKIETADGEGTAVVMHPIDAWKMFTRRTVNSGVLDAGTPFASLPMTVWGLQVYRTRAMNQGYSLAADFPRGAVIADRQQVLIETFTQHADYAQRNLILMRCEERVGLLVPRPDLFVYATL